MADITGLVLLCIVAVGLIYVVTHSDKVSSFTWFRKCDKCGLEKGILKCPGCGK